MWGDWRDGWAKRHPLRWGIFNAVGFFIAVVVVAVIHGRLTASVLPVALGFALGGFVLGTLGGYLARRVRPY